MNDPDQKPTLEYGRPNPRRRMSVWALLGYGVAIPLLLAEFAVLVLYATGDAASDHAGTVMLVIAGCVAIASFALFLLRS